MSVNELKNVKVSEIRENPVALRQVNRETEQYLELVESIRENGVLNAIVVREATDPDSGKLYYSLIDGLHRYTASCDAGKETIPANVITAEDADVLLLQIVSNIQRIETRPVEYSKQLIKILAQDPLMTAASLAHKLSKSPTWINERLGLLKMDENIQPLVDDGSINLSNAFALSKLPKEEQLAYVDRAQTMTPQEFSATILERKKALQKARSEGKTADSETFAAPLHMRKLKEVRDELERPNVIKALIQSLDISDPYAAALVAIQWVLHQDPMSVAEAKRKDDDRKRALSEKRNKANAERSKARADEALVKAARLQLQASLMDKGLSDEAIKVELADFDAKNGLVDGKFPKPEVAEGEVSE